MPLTMRNSSLLLAAIMLVQSHARADDFPEPPDTERDVGAGPLAPDKAAAGFRVPPGFKVSVFAAEPDVRNPIAMAWDHRGRLWVAENFTYADSKVKHDYSLRDRVVIFEDRDGDGRHDKRTVFTDDVQLLSSVELGYGGVWLMCPPQLLFIPDRDGDDKPDGEPQVLLDGFVPALENYHTFANGLKWGPDGWLYGRCGASSPGRIGIPGCADADRVPLFGGIWRYHPRRRTFEVLSHGTTNPWGMDWNEHGEAFFINTVNGHLWHVIPGAHFKRPHSIDPNPRCYETIDMHADHWHWDTGKDWSDSRKATGEHDRLGGGHAHIGAMIYLGDNWPVDYRGRLLTLNMHGRRANVERLEREGSGYVARHEPDTLFAADPWFRGIDLGYGPDGGVFVLDWSDTGECHDHTGVHRSSGRIFKVTHGESRQVVVPDLTKLPTRDLVAQLSHPNEWFRRHAQQVLTESILPSPPWGEGFGREVRGGAGVSPSDSKPVDRADRPSPLTPLPKGERGTKMSDDLRAMFQDGPDIPTKLRAMWTLFTTGHSDRSFLIAQLRHSDEHVRTWAVRMLVDDLPLDTILGQPHPQARPADDRLLAELARVATEDESGLVRLALASSLQRVAVSQRLKLAEPLVAREADANDHNLPLMIWYGLMPVADADPAALAKLATRCQLPTTRKFIARRLAEDIDLRPEPVNDLIVAVAVSRSKDFQADILTGITEGLAGWRKAPKPAAWDDVQTRLSNSGTAANRDRVRDLSVLFGDGRALDEVKRLALDNKGDLNLRRAALQTLIDNKPPDLRAICEQLLVVRYLNVTALRGLSLFDDQAIGDKLAKNVRSFHPTERPAVIDTLASRPAFARSLLNEIAAGKIAATDLTPIQARQIRSFGDEQLTKRLTELWGELRDSPDDKRQLIARLKTQLTPESLAAADRSQGRVLFNTACAACHRLYGHGGTIGPDLTGAGRQNLDYLLGNIVDPSAAVAADFRMSVVVLKDGRVLNGIVVAKTGKTLTLQTAKERTTLNHDDVEVVRLSSVSLMADGLLQPLKETQIRDLIAYLMSRSQVPLAP
ncbi:MAG: c-type cytochrome [Planctomycetales bacterium]|nr:c-type cytochrome [Planctomycetales bacterium]